VASHLSARGQNVAVGGVVCGALLTLLTIAWTVRIEPATRIDPASDAPPPSAERLQLGEQMYRDGVLPSGALLRGRHPGGSDVAGPLAACAQCHRRSGLGSVEGHRVVPPVTARFLFAPRAATAGRDHRRPAYTRETLLRALRNGLDAAGRPLDLSMPRFIVGADDADVLVDYLTQLSDRGSPGVGADAFHFATVLTPGVDPRRRQAMLDVLGAFFSAHNASTRLEALRDHSSPQAPHRTWQLDVWDLAGPPETWLAQLDDFAAHEPPFALVSGLGDGEWAPVHGFCETRAIPCWFPTVDLPVTAPDDFYSVYFTGGVALEAQLLAQEVRARRVVQVRGPDRAAAGGTQALRRTLAAAGVAVDTRALPVADVAALRDAVEVAGPGDALVLWLRPAEVARLQDIAPPAGAAVYVSTTLAGTQLPEAWRAQAHLVDPFELPELRRASVARLHVWLQIHGLPLVDERVQSDAYLACTLLAERVDDLQEAVTRERLLERAEATLAGGRPGIYHRLSLGPSQRVASKGGYITRFRDDGVLVADSGWLVP